MKKLLNISLGTVCPDLLAKAAGTNETIPLARIYGEATGVRVSRNGETVMGDFRGINLETGEEFSSSVVYLPRGLQETIIVALTENEDSAIRFAYDIWAEPEPKRKSYNIAFNDLTDDPTKPDPLSSFANTISSKSSFNTSKNKK